MGRGSGVAIDLGTPGSSSMNMQLGNRTRTEWGPRQRALVRARARFNAALPREGRIACQSRRCLLARQGVASQRELREWVIRPGSADIGSRQTSIARYASLELGALAGECMPSEG